MIRLELDLLPMPRHTDVAIVIDVLRMTTTAAAMLAHGYREVSVVAGVAEAHALAARTGALLFGERGGVALPGFDGGNSPLEHDGRDAGLTAVLCTTNGSKAVESVRAKHLLLGAIVNAGAVARRALELAEREVTLVCAGTDGAPSLDDVLAAGLVLGALRTAGDATTLSDTCLMALDVAAATGDPLSGLRRARHAGTLIDLGFEADVAYAAGLDRLDAVPERRSERPAVFAPAGSSGRAGPGGRGA
jgi:2-phosphosulfolactate phosphatase